MAQIGAEIDEAPGRDIQQGDEAVILAIVDEQQFRSVGRPGQPIDRARDAHDPRRFAARARQPDLALAAERDRIARRREDRLMPLPDQHRRRAVERRDVELLLGRSGQQPGIGQLAVRKFGIAAIDEGELRAVAAEHQIGKLDPVILRVSGELACRLALVGHPDVAHAGRILDPGEACHILRTDQIARNRQRERGLDRNRRGQRRRRHDQGGGKEQIPQHGGIVERRQRRDKQSCPRSIIP